MDWRDIEALVDLINQLASDKDGVETILGRAAVSLSRRDMLRLCHLIDARQAGNVDHRRIDALVERVDALVELELCARLPLDGHQKGRLGIVSF